MPKPKINIGKPPKKFIIPKDKLAELKHKILHAVETKDLPFDFRSGKFKKTKSKSKESKSKNIESKKTNRFKVNSIDNILKLDNNVFSDL